MRTLFRKVFFLFELFEEEKIKVIGVTERGPETTDKANEATDKGAKVTDCLPQRLRKLPYNNVYSTKLLFVQNYNFSKIIKKEVMY